MAATSGAASGAFQPPPDELKALSPFLLRAHETRTVDPALSYWCTFHAAQLGIPRISSLSTASKIFLTGLLDRLEAQKAELEGNDIVHGDSLVSRAHIENTALKVFGGADNEDRSGNATRATARRFLVAGNFIEVLTVFGPLDHEWQEKLKYAKWKAADIAKALREGRKPTPGPADAEDEVEVGAATLPSGEEGDRSTLQGIQAASDRMAGIADPASNLPSTAELEAEMARLGSQGPASPDGARAISPSVSNTAFTADDFTRLQPGRAASRLSLDLAKGIDSFSAASDASATRMAATSPNFSKPIHLQPSEGDDVPYAQPPPPAESYAGQAWTGDASLPHEQPYHGQGEVPSAPYEQSGAQHGFSSDPYSTDATQGVPHYDSSHAPFHQPDFVQPQASIPMPQPSAPPMPFPPPTASSTAYSAALPKAAVPAAAIVDPDTYPTTLDLNQIARVQKLAKWSISALDYEDVETARMHLREALGICEGRIAVKK